MTFRTRLTLWYAAIFSASLLVIGVATYSELVLETRAKMARHHHAKIDDDAGLDITHRSFFSTAARRLRLAFWVAGG